MLLAGDLWIYFIRFFSEDLEIIKVYYAQASNVVADAKHFVFNAFYSSAVWRRIKRYVLVDSGRVQVRFASSTAIWKTRNESCRLGLRTSLLCPLL
jgi:hypothetical protein